MDKFKLNQKQKDWASKKRQGVPASQLKRMLKRQKGLCKLSGAPLVFDPVECKPEKGGRGCHPLCPAVDHKDPSDPNSRVQIVSYRLNDLKGFMPWKCFKALCDTEPWKRLMRHWKEQAEKNPKDRDAFMRLLPSKAKRATHN